MDIPNLVSESIADSIHEFSDEYSVTVDNGHSYYFECAGTGTVAIYIGDSVNETIFIDSKNYKVFRGLIDNTYNQSVKFRFMTSYPMALKNMAIYKENFQSADDVPAYVDKIKYSMKDL